MTKDQANRAANRIMARLTSCPIETFTVELIENIILSCSKFVDVLDPEFKGELPFTQPETVIDSLRVHLCLWFKRRESTKWSEKEIRMLRKVATMKTHPDDFAILNAFYLSDCKFKRKDIYTLLNNWNGEIDRAKAWKPARGSDGQQGRQENIRGKDL